MTAGIRLVVHHNNFAALAAELTPRLSKVVAATALEVEATAKHDVPVKTGNLRRSLHTSFRDPLHAQVGTDVEYAPYVEYGTSHMAGQPYLTPAAERARVPFVAAVKRVLDRA
jgi:HK97 gp10 family phage protein